MYSQLSKFFAAVLATLLGSCATVDQFGSRIYDGNLNSQSAMNQEMLVNIIRASRYQSQNFIGVSQIAGGQTETLTTGLPTLTIGSHLTPVQHQVVISNGLSSAVTSSYQASPLVSTGFQSGMLQPIDERTVALLVASHPREPVFYLVLDRINIKAVDSGEVWGLTNDPTLNGNPNPMLFETQSIENIDTAYCGCKVQSEEQAKLLHPEKCATLGEKPWDGKDLYFPGTRCTYSKFVYLLDQLLAVGLKSELISSSNTGSASAAPSGAGQSTSLSPGRLCFDPASSAPSTQEYAVKYIKQRLCGTRTPTKTNPSSSSTITVTKGTSHSKDTSDSKGNTVVKDTSTDNNSKVSTVAVQENSLDRGESKLTYKLEGVGEVELSFEFRSPTGVFNFLGSVYRDRELAPVHNYYTNKARVLLGEGPIDRFGVEPQEPFLNIVSDRIGDVCYTYISYGGQPFCVPAESRNTPMLLDIRENLRNLSIQPTDLNAATTVRLQ